MAVRSPRGGTRFAGRTQGRTPNRTWNSFTMVASVAVAATTKVLIATGVPANAGIDLTVLRTRGIMMAIPSAPSADRFLTGAFGIMLVTDEAAAAGVASVPGPATDADNDGWFVHEWLMSRVEFSDATGLLDYAIQRYDSKAKRIFEQGQTLVAVVENLSSNAMSFATNFRCLDMVRGTH